MVGIALSSDTPRRGGFTCSDPMLNQLHNNIYWTQRANFIDIPTDCPQRDERMGWTGDAQVYIRTATLNTDVQAFFTKWLVDLEDGQRADGQFPCVAPCQVRRRRRRPGLGRRRRDLPLDHLRGLWRPPRPGAALRRDEALHRVLPPAQHARIAAAREVPLLRRLAQHQGRHAQGRHLHRLLRPQHRADGPGRRRCWARPQDADKYNALFEQIRAAFNRAYVAADGRIKGDTQTCYVLALAFDLVQGEKARAGRPNTWSRTSRSATGISPPASSAPRT